jgi:hypothetical protein
LKITIARVALSTPAILANPTFFIVVITDDQDTMGTKIIADDMGIDLIRSRP